MRVKARCPGRISLSKHADYINSHLLYLLDDRETRVEASLSDGDSIIKLENKDFGDRAIKLEDFQKALEDKLDWSFYPLKLLEELKVLDRLKNKELYIKVETDLPVAGGLSSSHALLLSCLRALTKLFAIEKFEEAFAALEEKPELAMDIIKLCQKIEQERGFKSGLGDQCAQLFSKKGYLSSIKIFPKLQVNYIKIPEDLSFITVPSFIQADKSQPEFIEKNKNIEKYKTLNELSKNFDCEHLADLHEKLDEKEIFAFLKSIDDKVTRGLALYGLAESKRVKLLTEGFQAEKLGEHLKLSHLAEKNFNFDESGKAIAIEEEEKLNYLFDENSALEKHSGFYHASTETNDKLQELALKHKGVFGSSITGAGFGGNNIIAAQSQYSKEIMEFLTEHFYLKEKPNQDLNLLHNCKSNDGVSLIES